MLKQIANRIELLSFKERALLLIATAAFFFALTQPAFTTRNNDGVQTTKGFDIFAFGGLAILGGGLLEWIIWLANPFILISVVNCLAGKARFKFLSIVAVLLAVSFYFWNSILGSESGRIDPILSKGVGYFSWLAAIILWMIFIFVMKPASPKSPGTPHIK